MSWKLAIIGMALSVMMNGGDGLEMVSITRTKSTTKSVGIDLLHICFDENIDDITDYDSITLDARVNDVAPIIDVPFYEYRDELSTDPKCKFFDGDLSDFGGHAVQMITEVRKDDMSSLGKSEAVFTIPDSFSDDADITSLKVGKRSDILDSLRLQDNNGGDISKWDLCIDGSVASEVNRICDNDICYFIQVAPGTTYSLCVKASDADTILQGATLQPTDVTETEEQPTEIKLTYGYDDVKGSMAITSGTSGLEFVPYQTTGEAYALCVSDGVACQFDYAESQDPMSILIVNTADSKSDVLTFNDYGAVVEDVGTNIIKAHWKKGDESYYGANIVVDGQFETELENSIVDCSKDDPNHPDNTYCFAYFTELNQVTYFVNMYPANDENLPALNNPLQDPNYLNKIRTRPGTVSLTRAAHQKQIMGITLLQDYSHTDDAFKVCYKGSETTSNKTRHEAVIIDETDHWLKIYQPTKGDDLTYCFSLIDLLTSSTPLEVYEDSELTVVVVERELSGYEVVASGQAHIELSGLRAFKAGEENINKSSSSILAIAGAVIVGIAFLMALVAATLMFVLKHKKINDDLQYPLPCINIEDRNNSHGLENPISIM